MFYVTCTGGPLGNKRRYTADVRLWTGGIRSAKKYRTLKEAQDDAEALQKLLAPRGYKVGTLQTTRRAR